MRSLGTSPDMPDRRSGPPVGRGRVEAASPPILAIGRPEGEGGLHRSPELCEQQREREQFTPGESLYDAPDEPGDPYPHCVPGGGVPRDGAPFEDGKEIDPEGSTIVGELAAEAQHIPPVMMAHECRRLVANHGAGHQAPVEDVEVSSSV